MFLRVLTLFFVVTSCADGRSVGRFGLCDICICRVREVNCRGRPLGPAAIRLSMENPLPFENFYLSGSGPFEHQFNCFAFENARFIDMADLTCSQVHWLFPCTDVWDSAEIVCEVDKTETAAQTTSTSTSPTRVIPPTSTHGPPQATSTFPTRVTPPTSTQGPPQTTSAFPTRVIPPTSTHGPPQTTSTFPTRVTPPTSTHGPPQTTSPRVTTTTTTTPPTPSLTLTPTTTITTTMATTMTPAPLTTVKTTASIESTPVIPTATTEPPGWQTQSKAPYPTWRTPAAPVGPGPVEPATNFTFHNSTSTSQPTIPNSTNSLSHADINQYYWFFAALIPLCLVFLLVVFHRCRRRRVHGRPRARRRSDSSRHAESIELSDMGQNETTDDDPLVEPVQFQKLKSRQSPPPSPSTGLKSGVWRDVPLVVPTETSTQWPHSGWPPTQVLGGPSTSMLPARRRLAALNKAARQV